MIAEIKSFLGIQKSLKEEKENIHKPFKSKPIDSPSSILIIDCDVYDDEYYEDFIETNFSEEVVNNLLNFWFARDFLEASAQIQLNPPDLIICELVLPLCQLLEEEEKINREFQKAINFEELASLQFKYFGKKFGYGLNVFRLLDKLDLEFRIPIIFYGVLGDDPEYKEQAKKLGAFACLKRDPSTYDLSLKMAIKAALKV